MDEELYFFTVRKMHQLQVKQIFLYRRWSPYESTFSSAHGCKAHNSPTFACKAFTSASNLFRSSTSLLYFSFRSSYLEPKHRQGDTDLL